jgi:TRAP-type mannitol/chloroaromatic compound transport system substrate-binding protein
MIALLTGGTAVSAETVRIEAASAYPASMPLLGDMARRLPEAISRASGGEIVLTFHEPGALAPAAEALDAVASGAAQATWANAGWFSNRDTAFNLFSSVPFGPGTGEYLAWLYHGGGLEMARDMFHRQGVHNVPCGLMAPESSGWFQREIKTTVDLRGLKMRFFGLGAKVMEKYGVIIQPLRPEQILPGFQSGTLDAAEFLVPSADKALGFDKVAKYYYFPGWHQRVTLFDLYINKAVWDGLPERHRAIIELTCGDEMRDMLAETEALQWQTLKDMQAEGVQLKRWPLEILISFQNTWKEVAMEESARNPNFKRVYESYAAFRENYAIWRHFNFLN